MSKRYSLASTCGVTGLLVISGNKETWLLQIAVREQVAPDSRVTVLPDNSWPTYGSWNTNTYTGRTRGTLVTTELSGLDPLPELSRRFCNGIVE